MKTPNAARARGGAGRGGAGRLPADREQKKKKKGLPGMVIQNGHPARNGHPSDDHLGDFPTKDDHSGEKGIKED